MLTMGRLRSFDLSITNYTCDSDAHSRYSLRNNKIEIEAQGLLTKLKKLKKSWPNHCEEGVAMNVTLEQTTRIPTQCISTSLAFTGCGQLLAEHKQLYTPSHFFSTEINRNYIFKTGSSYIAQAGLELALDPPASGFPVLGLQICATMHYSFF